MENTLSIIHVAEEVLLVVFILSIIRYLIKDTLISLILYVVSSIGICTLEIVSTLIKENLEQGYGIAMIGIFVYAGNTLMGVFFMRDRFDRKRKEDVDTDNE